jgi:hypothetical protein
MRNAIRDDANNTQLAELAQRRRRQCVSSL